MNGHRMNAKNPNLESSSLKKNQLAENFAHDFAEISKSNHGEGKQIEAKKRKTNHETYF